LNLLLLFSLSLVPFTTSWLGEHPSAAVPTAFYGIVLLCCAMSYTLLQFALIAVNGENTTFARAIASDVKGKVSAALYVVAIGCAFISPFIADGLFVCVAVIWFIPDTRMEAAILEHDGAAESD